MEILALIFLTISIIAATLGYYMLSWGTVLYSFWYWFLLPIFPSLYHINFIQAMGLVLVISLFHNHSTNDIKDEYRDSNKGLIGGLIAPWLTLLVGYIVHLIS